MIPKMTVLIRRLMKGSCPEVDISDLVYTCYRWHFKKLVFGKINQLEGCKKFEERISRRRLSAGLSQSLLLYRGPLVDRFSSDRIGHIAANLNVPYLESIL